MEPARPGGSGDAEHSRQRPPHQAGAHGRGGGHRHGRTKVSSAAVDAVAACGEAMPAKRTTKPTTAMAATAATFCVETTVPSTMNSSPPHRDPHRRWRGYGSARELDQQEQRERAEGGEQADLWFEKATCAMAKVAGITTAALTERLMTTRSGPWT